jgi:hypothetical protein
MASTLITALREANKSDDTRSLKKFCEAGVPDRKGKPNIQLPDELVANMWAGVESFVWDPKSKADDRTAESEECIDTLEYYFDQGYQKQLEATYCKKGQEKALTTFFTEREGGKGGGGGALAEKIMRDNGRKALNTTFGAYFEECSSKKAASKLIKKTKLLKANPKK